MSLTTFVARRALTAFAAAKLAEEIEAWRRSGLPATEYARRRAPAFLDLADTVDNGWGERLREVGDRVGSLVTSGGLPLAVAAASDAASTLEAAQRRVDELEQRVADLPDGETRVEQVRESASARVDELVERARRDTEKRLEAARERLADLEDRAAVHVDEVERRSRIVARSLVSEAEARQARSQAALMSELDRARAALLAAERRVADARRRERFEQGASPTGPVTPAPVRTRPSVVLANGHLDELGRDELYEIARDLDVRGRSSMSKAELVDAISSAS